VTFPLSALIAFLLLNWAVKMHQPQQSQTFTELQIKAYLTHLSLPQQYAKFIDNYESFPKTEEALEALTVAQLTRFPYENLSLHYSKTHHIDIDPLVVYTKLMGNGVGGPRGRGGYCMEISIFFNRILRALNFHAYTAGVRIRLREGGVPKGDFTGWRHIVNIVTLPSGKRFSVDVGFGGDGPTKPLPLVSGHVTQNLGPQEVRLIHGNMPGQSVPIQQKVWIYQYRNGANKEWNSFYAFPELEFFYDDFEVMNWFTSDNERSFQRQSCLVVRFIRAGETPKPLGINEENIKDSLKVVGKVMLVDTEVKVNMGGKTQTVQTCKTESERVQALETWFKIKLSREEMEGIRGWRTELL
jgi:arylamine N-acetyltransferase